MALADQQCIPCRGGVPPLPRARIDELLRELGTGWALNPKGHLQRTYEFADFAAALAFANRVGAMWFIKRVKIDGWDTERAMKEAEGIGLQAPNLKEFALTYVKAKG